MRRPRRLLVAYDGSAGARRALSCRLGPREELGRQARLLDEAQRGLALRGIAAQRIAAVGSEVREVVAAADRLGADLIVVPRRRGPISRFLGSPSARIARRASCARAGPRAVDAEGPAGAERVDRAGAARHRA
jgi:nucleotide-binding universal stress UspA family protein